MIRMLSKLIH